MEQLYELNLPSFKDVVRNDFAGFRNINLQYDYLTKTDVGCDKILKKEYLNLLGFDWNTYRYFKKSNCKGSIHTDLQSVSDRESKCCWAINWIYNGSGTLEFWNFENVKYIGMTSSSLNDAKVGIVPQFYTLKKPDYVYDTIEDHVYLINTSLPHRAVGNTGRCAFSLRAPKSYNMLWEQVLEKFSKLIKSK